MACFIVPATEAVVTTVITKIVRSKEAKLRNADDEKEIVIREKETKLPFSKKMGWLCNMLWGGSALLLFEHVWHGEVVPWAPFLTAAGNPDSAMEMLNEMSTAGVAMSVLVTAVWVGMVAVSGILEKRAKEDEKARGEASL